MRETLETERLTLRRLVLTDAARMAQLLNGANIASMTVSIPTSITELCAEFRILRFRAQWQRGLAYAYAITEGNDQLIGVMDLFENAGGDKELGYWLGEPYWGKGIITEAAHCVLKEGFETLGLPYIDAGYFEDNPVSGRVLDKLGFTGHGSKSNFYSIARGCRFPGIELRLTRDALKPA